jgi:glycerol-3-phosphate O-acyltransferase
MLDVLMQAVSLPAWLFVLLLAAASWWLAEKVIVPSLRAIMRGRSARVLREVDEQLAVRIPPFKLTRRQVLIDRLFHDERIQDAVAQHCRETGAPRRTVLRAVDRYAREIVPSFNAYLYFRFGYWLARSVARSLYRVRLGYADRDALAGIAPGSTIVFVINHRSNMDYVLVAFLVAEHVAVSYAVGEWARVWPLQTLIRSLGAFFVRRRSGDPLYRAVLQRYVQMATEAGVPQAMFPEGGLTRDGALREPKLGLLDYMLKGFDPAGPRDLVFVPVGLNYDRVLEDRTLVGGADGGLPKGVGRTAVITVGFLAKHLWLVLTGRWFRLGYACVNFGSPVSTRAYLATDGGDLRALAEPERHRRVAAFGRHLMAEVGRVIPVLPVSLVASIFAEEPGSALSELEIKAAVLARMRSLEERGFHVYVPRADQDYAVSVGLRMLSLRRLVAVRDGLYTAEPNELKVLNYYANAVVHLLRTA